MRSSVLLGGLAPELGSFCPKKAARRRIWILVPGFGSARFAHFAFLHPKNDFVSSCSVSPARIFP